MGGGGVVWVVRVVEGGKGVVGSFLVMAAQAAKEVQERQLYSVIISIIFLNISSPLEIILELDIRFPIRTQYYALG